MSQEKNVVVIKAVFDSAEVKSAINKTYKELSGKANIKGFRKGHVPAKTLDLFYGKEAIYAETMERIIPEALDTLVEEYELKLIQQPELEPAKLEAGKEYSFTATFEVFPEVTLPNISELEAEKIIYTPTEEMVEENIKRILESQSEILPTYEERALTKEDYVSIKYSSNIVDEEGNVSVIEEDKKIEINLGLDGMPDKVVDALLGKKPGETVTVDFPVDKDTEELKGKGMRYIIEILGIMKKEVPALTDATVEKITKGQAKTVEEFRSTVMEQLTNSANIQSENSLREAAIATVVEKSELDVPENVVERQAEAMKEEQIRRLKSESGLTLDEYLEQTGLEADKYDEELHESATSLVKRAFVLEAIADDNDIQWSVEEIDQEITRTALTSGIDLKKFKDYIFADKNRIYEMAERVRSRKTVDFIVSQVKAIEVAEEKKSEK